MDIMSKIMDYEDGELSPKEVVDFFSDLLKTNTVWSLHGSYQRTANDLIQAGYLDTQGNVLSYP